MSTVSIIGTSGKEGNMTNDLFRAMIKKAHKIIKEEFNLDPKDVTLVSGGASWADHVAVRLFLTGKYKHLTLHMPCKWLGSGFLDNGAYSWAVNPGRTANTYHKRFSQDIGRDTLGEIGSCGAKIIDTYKGFHHRNTAVARSDFLIAFTWSDTDRPEKGGTLDTWNKCVSRKVHVSLKEL
jgi:hypothetical protein